MPSQPPIPFEHMKLADAFTQVASLSNTNHFNASARMALEQRHTIRLLASSTSVFSIGAATCAVYWFYMMRRNFRRDLVLLLIMGDFWKSLWFLTFACITYTHERIRSESAVCQVSGFMLQMGTMMCDFAIFFMSLHMWLQIFPPQDSFLGHDGLYRIRRWVIAAWLILPNLSAALAFVKGRWAYEAGGAFCSLPLRPYWYRLALSWIPRYLIWIFVMGVAIRIYKHVGKEFKVFGEERDRSSSFSIPGESTMGRMADPTTNTQSSIRRKSAAADQTDLEKQTLEEDDEEDEENMAPDGISIRAIKSPALPRQSIAESTKSLPRTSSPSASGPDWTATFGFPAEPLSGPQSIQSTPTSRRGSRQIANGVLAEDFAPPAIFDANRHRGSITTLGSLKSSASQTVDETTILPPIIETKRSSASTGVNTAQGLANAAVTLRRRAIQRQLRLLFIYPCVYMILWAIPFVVHSMNYSDRFAQHPITPLVAVNVFCQCFMGFVDVTVFSWREKPWRHIPGSDGTFLGSFCFWRFCFGREWVETVMQRRRGSRGGGRNNGRRDDSLATEEKSSSRAGLLSSLKRWSISTSKGPSPRGSEASVPPSSTTMTTPGTQQQQQQQHERIPRPPPHRRPTTSHRRAYSGGSDRRHLEAERAHERLAMERADLQQQQQQQHRLSLQEESRRRASGISEPICINLSSTSPPGKEERKREWWDTHHEDLHDP
ncbi:hypothetical protein KC340_g10619 [Hortaea werneckii]|nr:hypothetical protein KC342_g2502 [Hortaea werneckii]KAI7104469.1 hypothetical protein KC339_g4522 [Hortaea werneckii]KAI7244587.1 hypothetical protein KC365_g1288 [Hortaea werneckii]KAI7309986.1 hypothetical protein KC340_g10619 [Hortaea werneckii]KAI7375674.1 hypothetical protein KC328_g15296 [Hortaea werneckii]